MASVTGAMLYVYPRLGQTSVGPEIGPGVAGVPGFTVMVMVLLVTFVGDAHKALEVIST